MFAFGAEIVKKYGIKVAKDALVVKEGEATRELYIVHKGELQALKDFNGEERVVGRIREGDFFGELSLLNNEARSATVKALQASVLIKISPDSFDNLVKKFPDLSLKIIRALASRLKKSSDEVASLQEQEDDIKLLKSLVAKINSMGRKTVKGLIVEVSLDTIAKEIKTPDEVLEKIKEDLMDAKNVIKFKEDASLEIPSMELLQEFIQFIIFRKKIIPKEEKALPNDDESLVKKIKVVQQL